jgi:hypothetical protein
MPHQDHRSTQWDIIPDGRKPLRYSRSHPAKRPCISFGPLLLQAAQARAGIAGME